MNPDRDGTVYTETIVYSPPEQYAADAPYQIAIIDLSNGERVTVRVLGKNADERVYIGDRVTFVEDKNGVAYYKRAD
ncbi:MAG: OB-fold domain-containing protein [Acidobacteriaceae bacterium]|nr:OB-fold domain-containing protein [Acidobacteriaceae bacterium]MBV9501777.1 OB-fold domain-containing protein [Acidobacteriaceae bacterium]